MLENEIMKSNNATLVSDDVSVVEEPDNNNSLAAIFASVKASANNSQPVVTAETIFQEYFNSNLVKVCRNYLRL